MLGFSTAVLIIGFGFAPILTLAEMIEEPPRPLPKRAESNTGWHATGSHGAVSAGGAEAVEAGMTVLRSNGNAVDAAVATILALSITDANLFCFGGEVPIMIYNSQRNATEVLSGQGVAPRLATQAHFAPRGPLPTRGIEVATVPAVLDACLVSLERHGTMRFTEVVAPTLELLNRNHQPWHLQLKATLLELVAVEQTSNDRLIGYRHIADHFYRGPIARKIDSWSRQNGGLLRYEDLATHVTRIEEPIQAEFRGYTVLKCGPWTQGPALLEALQILEPDSMLASGPDTPDTIHTVTEAMKLALADRDQWYADPLFVEVPTRQLLDPAYATLRRSLIDPNHASLQLRPGNPVEMQPLATVKPLTSPRPNKPQDTSTCLVADRWGNVVAATPSGWTGSLAGDTGVWLGSRLQSFRIEPDHPNVIEPGKRPRITLTPTLVLKDHKPVMAVSVAGADLQDQVTLQMLVKHLVFGEDYKTTVTSPRFSTEHHIGSFAQSPPKLGSLTLQSAFPEAVATELGQRGHILQRTDGIIAAPSILILDPTRGTLEASGDPKSGRHAAAY